MTTVNYLTNDTELLPQGQLYVCLSFLTDKDFSDESVLQKSMNILYEEIESARCQQDPLETSFEYRKNLAVGLFYK